MHNCQNTELLKDIGVRVTTVETSNSTLATNMGAVVGRLDSLIRVLTKIGYMLATSLFSALSYLIVNWVEGR